MRSLCRRGFRQSGRTQRERRRWAVPLSFASRPPKRGADRTPGSATISWRLPSRSKVRRGQIGIHPQVRIVREQAGAIVEADQQETPADRLAVAVGLSFTGTGRIEYIECPRIGSSTSVLLESSPTENRSFVLAVPASKKLMPKYVDSSGCRPLHGYRSWCRFAGQ